MDLDKLNLVKIAYGGLAIFILAPAAKK